MQRAKSLEKTLILGKTDPAAEVQYFGPLIRGADLLEEIMMLGKIESRKKRVTEDETAGWYHSLNGNEFGQTLGVSEGQGSLV